MQQLLAHLLQLWQAVGWNGISAIAALIVACDAVRKRREPPQLPPPRSLPPHLVRKPHRRNRNRRKAP
jgi:hypothetical protein